MRLPKGTDSALVFLGALALFASSVTEFKIRPTDVSALRVLGGEVPYRDFWTMYAPGSFVTLAGAYAVFGRELIVSNLLGIVTSAAAVALFYRLARPVVNLPLAVGFSAIVALAFFSSGYHAGFTSYPPVLLLILAAVSVAAGRAHESGWRWTWLAGVLLGLAALFKHDVAGYAALAAGGAAIVSRSGRGVAVWTPVAALGVTAAVVPAVAALLLAALGGGADLWNDLIHFPLFEFRYTRGEYFPIIPRLNLTGSRTAMVFELRQWAVCNLPTIAAGIGSYGLWRGWRSFDARSRFLAVFALVAFVFHWMAAHVQINTNVMTLAAWGTLAGGIGVRGLPPATGRWLRRAFGPVAVAWGALLIAPVVDDYRLRPPATTALGLPGLSGIRVPPAAAERWQQLAATLADAGPPDAPLLLLSNRNDLVVYSQPLPFWLSPRRSATRHHELHPGVTDTWAVQRRMLEDVARGPLPVVVREHRFDDATIDRQRRIVATDPLPRGADLLDTWIAEHYDPGPRFGMYEVMRPKGTQ